MDSATRIKVLERLAHSNTPAAQAAIVRACEQAFATLAQSNEYEALEPEIETLAKVGFRQSKETVSALDGFVRSVEARKLVHSSEFGALGEALSKYRNARTLISKAIEVLSILRYLQTAAVVDTLLWASMHADESVRKSATSALSALAKYELSVFYGQENGGNRGIGATPQLEVIGCLEQISDSALRDCLPGVLTLLEGMLSTLMETAKWSSAAVTLTQAPTPARDDVVSVRQRSIALLKNLYDLFDATTQKKSIIRVLNAATRAQSNVVVDDVYREMMVSNAKEVLDFFACIAKAEDLEIVQKLESDSYWIHYNSPSEEVRAAALRVKTVIDANEEYAIYKVLVGFEGVFGDWSVSKHDQSFELGSQQARMKESHSFIARIADEGFEIWRKRILKFAETESNDLAAFPVFYEFLADVANSYPSFALDILVNDAEKMSRFLIPILRGLWDSEKHDRLRSLMQAWVRQSTSDNTTFLFSCTKVFLSTQGVDVELLGHILEKATELGNAFVLRQIVSVAVVRFAAETNRGELKGLFLQALSRLTDLHDANWVREIWYRKEKAEMVAALTAGERREVLKNLRFLAQIDYQAEDLLAVIAERDPREVLVYLCERMYDSLEEGQAIARKAIADYEELPFQLDKLREPLACHPKMVVDLVLSCYRQDASLFQYRGAKLLEIIFPQFSQGFEEELVQLARSGGDAELEFVAGILRAFSGEVFIHPVAKELIKRLPSSSPLVIEVEVALQSTGVVSGEYGMADAFERKRLEVLDWLQDPEDRVRAFVGKYIADLEHMRDRERARADESIALRKFKYGE